MNPLFRSLTLLLTPLFVTNALADGLPLIEFGVPDTNHSGSMGVAVELNQKSEWSRFLVAVDYRGFSTANTPQWRFMMVSGRVMYEQAENANAGFEGENAKRGEAPIIEVEVVPVTELMSVVHDARSRGVTQLRIVPVTLGRNTDTGIEVGVTARAIDVATSSEIAVIPGDISGAENARLSVFAKVAGYIAGFRMMKMSDQSTFTGAQVGQIQSEIGMNARLTDRIAVRLTAGARVGYATGSLSNGTQNTRPAHIFENDFYARLEAMLTLETAQFSLYSQAGGRTIYRIDNGDPKNDGSMYVQFGVMGYFK